MKFRKKPAVIESFCLGVDPQPNWFTDCVSDNTIVIVNDDGRWRGGPDRAFIQTLEGVMEAKFGDWIIRGIRGEIYPCKSDIFEATYEAVE